MAPITYSEFINSEFYGFFNLREVASSINGETTVYSLKTGGFQEYIDIFMHVNKNKNNEIQKGELIINRSWMGSIDHINPFTNDILKSFIDAMTPIDDKDAVEPLIYFIFQLRGVKDKVFIINQQQNLFKRTVEIDHFLSVYLNQEPKYEMKFKNCLFIIENMVHSIISYIKITALPK